MKVKVSQEAKAHHAAAMKEIDELVKATGKTWGIMYEPYLGMLCAGMHIGGIALGVAGAAFYDYYKRHKENKETDEEC